MHSGNRCFVSLGAIPHESMYPADNWLNTPPVAFSRQWIDLSSLYFVTLSDKRAAAIYILTNLVCLGRVSNLRPLPSELSETVKEIVTGC